MSKAYQAFGLCIRSELDLPELPLHPDQAAAADVEIRVGRVAGELAGAQFVEKGVWAKEGALLIDYDEGRYLAGDGREIVVQPAAGASERDVRSYLLGSAIGAICHQRGLLPLHANAVEIDGLAVAFAGPSGAGKSTLAACFNRMGYRVLCDDVCVVSFDDNGAPWVQPGVPRIKLWDDALEALGIDKQALERVSDGDEKYILPIDSVSDLRPFSLGAIYVLQEPAEAEPSGIVKLSGADSLGAISNNIYRNEFITPLGQNSVQFGNAVSLARKVAAYAAPTTWGYEQLQSVEKDPLRHVRQTLARIANACD